MHRIPVVSSNIAEIGYDEVSATLEVMFSDGRVYQYFDVPKGTYEQLMCASSVGQFFNTQIRGIYRFART